LPTPALWSSISFRLWRKNNDPRPLWNTAGGVRVLIATRPVDFRRGADSLAAAVQSVLGHDPFCGTIFVFRSKRADRVKMLVYDGTGLVLIRKRLEGTKFK
jgi:transposase